MKFSKTTKTIVILSLMMTSIIPLSMAKFRGGTVHDIQNEIRQALMAVKENEKLQQIKKITEIQKKIDSHFTKLTEYKNQIQTTIGQANGLKRNIQGLLSNPKDAVSALKELSHLDFSKIGKSFDSDFLKENAKQMDEKLEINIQNTNTKANEILKTSEKLSKTADKVLEEKSEGVMSEKQKEALLDGIIANQMIHHGIVANQRLMMKTARDARKQGDNAIGEAYNQQNQYELVHNNEHRKKTIQERTLKRMPRFNE